MATDKLVQILSVGQKANSEWLGKWVNLTPGGFISVRPSLQAEGPLDNVFAVGDIAETGAQKAAKPAIPLGQLAARNLCRLVRGESQELERFELEPFGIKLSLGLVSC